jgi:hypothetical protein
MYEGCSCESFFNYLSNFPGIKALAAENSGNQWIAATDETQVTISDLLELD